MILSTQEHALSAPHRRSPRARLSRLYLALQGIATLCGEFAFASRHTSRLFFGCFAGYNEMHPLNPAGSFDTPKAAPITIGPRLTNANQEFALRSPVRPRR
jgi:hypothetical protein